MPNQRGRFPPIRCAGGCGREDGRRLPADPVPRQKLFREGRLWSNSRRHGRMRRPAGPHELKPTLDLHSAPMQLVWRPGKRGIFLRVRGFQTPEATIGRIGRYLKKYKRLPPRPATRLAVRSHAECWQKGCRVHLPGEGSRPAACIRLNTLVVGSIRGRSAIRSRNRPPRNSSPRRRRATCGWPSSAFSRPSRSSSGGPDRQRLRVPRGLRGAASGARHGHAADPATQSRTEWPRRTAPAHRAQGALRNLLSRNPLDSYRQDGRRFVGPRNHVRSHASTGGRTPVGCVPGHPRESLRRNRAATGPGRKTNADRPHAGMQNLLIACMR